MSFDEYFTETFTETGGITIEIEKPGRLIITAIGGGGGAGPNIPKGKSGGNGGVVVSTYENIPAMSLSLNIFIGGGGGGGGGGGNNGGGGGGGYTLVRHSLEVDPIVWVMAGGGGGGSFDYSGGNCNVISPDGKEGRGGGGGTQDASAGCGFGGFFYGGKGGIYYDSGGIEVKVGENGGDFGFDGSNNNTDYSAGSGGGGSLNVSGQNSGEKGGLGAGGIGGANGGGAGGSINPSGVMGCGGGGGGYGGGGSGGFFGNTEGDGGAGGAGGSYDRLPGYTDTDTDTDTAYQDTDTADPADPGNYLSQSSFNLLVKPLPISQTTRFTDPITLFGEGNNLSKYGYGGYYDLNNESNENDSPDGSGGYVKIEFIPYAVVCFPAKTPITTDQGLVNIENINPNMHTIDNKKIIAISKTISSEKHLVCIQPNALGKNCPSKRTVMSLLHGIYIDGKLVKAKDLINKKDIYRISYKKEILYNVVMEQHNKMGVNNMICETMNPKTSIAKLYMKQYKDKLAKMAKAKKSIVNNNNTINK
jgi:hypothetical protein